MQGSALVGIFENMKYEIYWEFLFLDYIWTANQKYGPLSSDMCNPTTNTE